MLCSDVCSCKQICIREGIQGSEGHLTPPITRKIIDYVMSQVNQFNKIVATNQKVLFNMGYNDREEDYICHDVFFL